MLKVRQPYVAQTIAFPSPSDPDTIFQIKKLGNRELLAHRDRNSVVRYVQEDESGRFVTEKDYPAGTMRLETILLGLDSWNIATSDGAAAPITLDSIVEMTDPDELDALYDKIVEINPILIGKETRKNS